MSTPMHPFDGKTTLKQSALHKSEITTGIAEATEDLRDHRRIASQHGLFSLQLDQESTLIWHPKGFQILNDLMEHLRAGRKKAGSMEVHKRSLLPAQLYDGTLGNESERFAPQNFKHFLGAPLQIELLPLGLFEINIHSRNTAESTFPSLLQEAYTIQERSDTLCSSTQIQNVFQADLLFNLALYERLGLDEFLILCRRDKIKVQSIDTSRISRQDLLKQLSVPTDTAWNSFSVEFQFRDSLGRTWQLGQVAVRNCSECSERIYDRDGYRLPLYIVHSYALGSIERFIAIMLEHKANDLPLWLTPTQVAIIPVSKRNDLLATAFHRQLQEAGVRSEVERGQGAIGYRVRNLKNRRVPYLAIINDADAANGEVTLYDPGRKAKHKLSISQAASFFKQCLPFAR